MAYREDIWWPGNTRAGLGGEGEEGEVGEEGKRMWASVGKGICKDGRKGRKKNVKEMRYNGKRDRKM